MEREPFATGLRNYATLFLMPAMQLDQLDLNRNSFYNCYIEDQNRYIDGKNLLYCLFKPTVDRVFEQFLEKLADLGVLVCDYDYEGGWCVLVLEFPEEFGDDFRKILDSEYSKTSQAFRDLHSATLTIHVDGVGKVVPNKIRSALERSEIMREIVGTYFGVDVERIGDDFEYWPKFDAGKVSNILNIDEINGK